MCELSIQIRGTPQRAKIFCTEQLRCHGTHYVQKVCKAEQAQETKDNQGCASAGKRKDSLSTTSIHMLLDIEAQNRQAWSIKMEQSPHSVAWAPCSPLDKPCAAHRHHLQINGHNSELLSLQDASLSELLAGDLCGVVASARREEEVMHTEHPCLGLVRYLCQNLLLKAAREHAAQPECNVICSFKQCLVPRMHPVKQHKDDHVEYCLQLRANAVEPDFQCLDRYKQGVPAGHLAL